MRSEESSGRSSTARTGAGVLQNEVLVLERGAVHGPAARAVSVGDVAALNHELVDDAMELGPLVPVPVLARGQLPEVLRRLRHHVAEQRHHDAAGGRTPDLDVEVDLVRDAGVIGVGGDGGHGDDSQHAQRGDDLHGARFDVVPGA